MARVAEFEAKLNLPPKTPSNSSLRLEGPESKPAGEGEETAQRPPGVARKLAENPDASAMSLPLFALNAERPLAQRSAGGIRLRSHRSAGDQARGDAGQHSQRRLPACGKRIAGAARGYAAGQPVRPWYRRAGDLSAHRHMVSYNRLVEMFKGLFGLEISEGAMPIYSAARTHRSPRKRDASMPRCVRQP